MDVRSSSTTRLGDEVENEEEREGGGEEIEKEINTDWSIGSKKEKKSAVNRVERGSLGCLTPHYARDTGGAGPRNQLPGTAKAEEINFAQRDRSDKM